MVKVLILFLVLILSLQICFPTTDRIREIEIDGIINLPNEWHEDEVYYDSQNDSPWGVYNELHKLFVSWDETALYIGVVGVQKDGNNLIVYLDTSPFSGIDDASKLKDPNNPQQLWWWRRGNKFPENFKPEFQWHMYEMQLNINQGHGLFKLNDDYTTVSLNNEVKQKSYGGGTKKLGSAEIKIPWKVFYGCPFFPKDKEIGILVCMTGGMDTKGTHDVSDDQFGSARDTIPDQKQTFPQIWYEKVKIDTFLRIKLDRVEGRQPYSRNLTISDFTGDSVVIKFDSFPWDKKRIESAYLIFCSTSFDNIRYGIVKTATNTMVRFENLSSGNTYYFAVAISTDSGVSETVQLYIPEFEIVGYKPQKFLFPTKDLKIDFFCKGGTNKKVKFHWRYKGNIEFEDIPLENESAGVYTVKLQNVQKSVEFYITAGTELRYPKEGLAMIEVLNKDTIILTPEINKDVVLYDGANYKLKISVSQNAVSTIETLLVKNCPKEQLLSYLVLKDKISLDDVETVFQIYTEDGKNLKFVKPIEITLTSDDSDTVIFFDGEGGFYDLSSAKTGNEISFKLYSTGFVILTKKKSQQNVYRESKLVKVVNPKFSQTGPWLQLVFTSNSGNKQVRIFDLNYNLVWESGMRHEDCIIWDGKTNSFLPVPKGLYIYQIKFENGEVVTGLCTVK